MNNSVLYVFKVVTGNWPLWDGERWEPFREESHQLIAIKNHRVAYVPPFRTGGFIDQDVAARDVVDVDVPHPSKHGELLCLSCKKMVFADI